MSDQSTQPAAHQPRPAVPGPESRTWLRLWRRTTQPTPPDLDELTHHPGRDHKSTLLDRGPFTIGFFLAIGALFAYGLLQAASQLQSIIVLVLLSLAIALGLNPAVEWLHRRGIRRGLCVLLVILALLLIVGLVVWAVVPVASTQISYLYDRAPEYLNSLRQNPQIAAFDQEYQVISKVTQYLTSGDFLNGLFGSLAGATSVIANVVFSVILTIVLTVYFLASLTTFKEVIYRLAPSSKRTRVRFLANEMLKRVGGYVSGLFLVVLIDSAFALIFLNVVGLFGFQQITNLSLALACIVAILALIPIVGSTIWIIVITIVNFSFSPTLGVVTLAILLVWQQVDAYVIQPRIFSRSVKVPGILIILAAASGYALLGMMGAILAVPIMAALMLLYREVLIPHLDRS